MDEPVGRCDHDLTMTAAPAWPGPEEAMTAELATEAEKMRRVPGIVFADGPAGRRARVAGTGLEVWEIIKNYRAFGENFEKLRLRFDWLSEVQVWAAVRYYETYPDEIIAMIEDNARYTPEYVYTKYPFTRPKHQ
jgi:uncharacterized protein (DUF433 family)